MSHPDAQTAANTLHEAAELIAEDPIREGSLLRFGSAGQLVVTADMHGNLRNFDKLQHFCALERSPGRCVLLQELIHEEPEGLDAPDLSIDLLLRAAKWKCDFPDNVFFIQSNHEMSQYCGHEITKGGRSVIRDFERGVETRFGKDADRVMDGVHAYIGALPLAARTANGVFISHSLPDTLSMSSFDTSVFDRLPTATDMAPGGSAYALVWGRFQPPEAVDFFLKKVDAKVAVVGHTPQEEGYAVIGNMLIIASDHNHGVFLPIDLSRAHTVDELASKARKFVAVDMG